MQARIPAIGGIAAAAGWISAAALAAEVAWKPPIEVAAGGGERGPWRQNESRYDYVDDPAVAIAPEGAMTVVWVDQGRKDVFLQRFDPAGKPAGEPLNVSRSPATFSWLPRIALAPARPERVLVLWQEIIFSGGSHGGEILFARSEDGGATFSEPRNLSLSQAGDGKGRIRSDYWHNGSLDLAAGRDGAIYAAWTEYEGRLWVARSLDGERFSLVQLHDRSPARAPSLAVAPDATVHLAWTVGEDDAADIRVARSADGGASFSPARVVEPSPGYSDAPKIAADRAGVLHLVHAESAGGPFDRYRVRYARSTDGGKSFERSRPVSPANAAFPSLALDDAGGVYVLWEDFGAGRQRPRGLSLAVSRDGGASFGPHSSVPHSAGPPGHWNGSFQGLLMKKLAVNATGTLAVANSSLKDGDRSRVWIVTAARGSRGSAR